MDAQMYQVGVKALITNEAGEYLLLKKTTWWEQPGGRMEEGENFEGTLRRELKEELGADLATMDSRPLAALTIKNNGQWMIFLFFKVFLQSDTITLSPEFREYAYFDKDHINPDEHSEITKYIFNLI